MTLPARQQLAVIGLGLIGGSFALALRQAGYVRHVTGFDTDPEQMRQAVDLGVIDQACPDIATAVATADLVFVAVPVGRIRQVFDKIKGHLLPTALVMDGGSTKGSVIADFRTACADHLHQFIPAHPIAGKETSGVRAASADLYMQRHIILTLTGQETETVRQGAQAAWQACGAQIVHMTAEQHDHILAATSHLPHLLAFTLMSVLAEQTDQAKLPICAGGGLRDFTRIAGSDPIMWRDIALANQTALGRGLRSYIHHLEQLADQLDAGDGIAIHQCFAQAQSLHRRLQFNDSAMTTASI
jgi:prephenate dehydrogenase